VNFAKAGRGLRELWQSLNHRVKLCQSWWKSVGTSAKFESPRETLPSWCKSVGALAKFESSRETLPKLMQVSRSFGKV